MCNIIKDLFLFYNTISINDNNNIIIIINNQLWLGLTLGRLVVTVKLSEKKEKKSWTCHISTESWDSCDFNYVNHFKIL